MAIMAVSCRRQHCSWRLTSFWGQSIADGETLAYFPAYEIVNDELRDYRFYAPDMLHPSQQAVDYIWERFLETVFSDAAKSYLQEWKPIKEALAHRPFNPDSDAYRSFLARTLEQKGKLAKKYPWLSPQQNQ